MAYLIKKVSDAQMCFGKYRRTLALMKCCGLAARGP